ncbi:MAG: hypothetical protein P1V21_02790 [Rhizobiaceae bacterium]|nr:hypothetical protein [Rhizobiaceae bacterium]
MLKHSSTRTPSFLSTVLARFMQGSARQPVWCSDPLAHPDIKRMTLQQVADLPLDPADVAACGDEQ